MDENQERPKLKLVSKQNLDIAEVYGVLFHTLADEVEAIMARAEQHFKDAVDSGVPPEAMAADYSLEMLGLAKRTNITKFNSDDPVMEYAYAPDDDLCDCGEFDDDGGA